MFTLILSLLLAAVVLAALVFLTRHRATRHRRAGEGGSRAATFRGHELARAAHARFGPDGLKLPRNTLSMRAHSGSGQKFKQ